jgi:cob(I)alamin adenosyltransferase
MGALGAPVGPGQSRRAERSVVTLARDEQVSPVIMHYLNRLSDLLFMLARGVNQLAGRPDITW